MEKAKCKYCEYCKRQGGETGRYTNGRYRNTYYCENKEVNNIPLQEFGNRAPGFVGYGKTVTYGTGELQLKTAPKWCPKNKNTIRKVQRSERKAET